MKKLFKTVMPDYLKSSDNSIYWTDYFTKPEATVARVTLTNAVS